MLATTGEQGEPMVVPCSCLKNLSWKVKTQFSKTNLRSCIISSFSRPMVLCLKEQPYLCLASGSSICSMKSLLMMSKAVGTGMLVNRAETSKKTSSSSPLMFTDLKWSLKLLLSLTKDGVIPVYLWRILVPYFPVPYFPGLSESYKKIFKYMPIQVCFRGVNTLKSMLMHPKDKISNDQKKDLVYHWECKADGCNSAYIGEMSRALGERVKEHSKSKTLAILKHCKDFHHPLPSISDFNIIDKDPSQITWEAKEAIHIRRLDPSLNRNIGKMSIPHCFDHLLGAKPKHPQVRALVAPQSVDEIAPPSQIPGLNLTQFNNIGNFRPNVAQHIPRPSTRACRARNLFN